MLQLLWLLFVLLVTVTSYPKSALVIIDVQDCFLAGGNLAVSDSDQVIPVINNIRRKYEQKFSLVILSQDWHCHDHVSFVSSHPGNTVYQVVNLAYNKAGELCFGDNVPATYPHAHLCNVTAHVVPQTLWPDHCVMNVTSGPTSAAFSKLLTREPSDIVIRKGFNCEVDSYSVFFDNGGFRQTDLNATLSAHGISRVYIAGLALDYCVYYTAKDANSLGFDTYLIQDATRGVAESSVTHALEDMKSRGIHIVQSGNIEMTFTSRGTAIEKHVLFIVVVMAVVITA